MPHTSTQSNIESVTLIRTQVSGPGPRLRAAREALGLGLKDIAKRMRLQEHIIHQIEQDMYDENTALVFVKGYLRSYAVLVGLNADQIIQDFTSMGLSEDRDAPDLTKLIKKSDKPRRMNIPLVLQSNPAVLWSCAAGTALAVVGLLWAYSGSITTMGAQPAVVATQAAPVQPTPPALEAALPAAPLAAPAAIDPKLATQAKNTPAPAAATTPGAPAPKAETTTAEPLLF